MLKTSIGLKYLSAEKMKHSLVCKSNLLSNEISAGTAIGQNHVPNLHFIDQGPEDGVELDNLLLERRSSTKSFTSRRSSSLSRKESLPTVQVIPPSVAGGNIFTYKYNE